MRKPNEANASDIATEVFSTPVGHLLGQATDKAIIGLSFADAKATGASDKSRLLQQLRRDLERYFAGKLTEFDLPLDLRGTDFQVRVWRQLLKIPYGQTVSYKQLAKMVGSPAAVRAVGQANGRNPVAIIVPCHRVIAADGNIGGYGGGLERKRLLLELERDSRRSKSAR